VTNREGRPASSMLIPSCQSTKQTHTSYRSFRTKILLHFWHMEGGKRKKLWRGYGRV